MEAQRLNRNLHMNQTGNDKEGCVLTVSRHRQPPIYRYVSQTKSSRKSAAFKISYLFFLEVGFKDGFFAP